MRIATFNVNSLRARMPVLTQWLAESRPDVVAIQETKVEDAKFPLADIEAAGYRVAFHGQPRYNGVALLSLAPLEDVQCGFGVEDMPEDCRLISARVQGVLVVNSYVPNGTQIGSEKFAYKLRWFEEFRKRCDMMDRQDRIVWLGDMNVAPTADDVFEPNKHAGTLGFHPDEIANLGKVLEWGWVDCFRKFTHGPGHYTFWEYVIPNGFKRNLGWRIDHIYASPGLADCCNACEIDTVPRAWEKPSDHTPVVASFTL